MIDPPRYAAGQRGKLLSTCSAGLVDFRSDKERVARSARKTLHATRTQSRILRGQAYGPQPVYEMPMPVAWQPVAYAVPPGWYPDPAGQPLLRWWDGQAWTAGTAPR